MDLLLLISPFSTTLALYFQIGLVYQLRCWSTGSSDDRALCDYDV